MVQWPNGVTIDFFAERLYWVDAKADYIASADLDGKNIKKILEGTVYWMLRNGTDLVFSRSLSLSSRVKRCIHLLWLFSKT